MQIKVRLFATLRTGRSKEMILELKEGTIPQLIVEMLKIPLHQVSILLINGRDGKLDTVLKDSDVVSIFPPVGGG